MDMPGEAASSDIKGIYLDTKVLFRGEQWPVPSILLNNLLRLAGLCGISRFLPNPVIKEAEEHWVRGVKDSISALSGAKRTLQRIATPLSCEINVAHPSIEDLHNEYRKKV